MKPSEIIGKNATESSFNHEPSAEDFVVAIMNYLDSQHEAEQKRNNEESLSEERYIELWKKCFRMAEQKKDILQEQCGIAKS